MSIWQIQRQNHVSYRNVGVSSELWLEMRYPLKVIFSGSSLPSHMNATASVPGNIHIYNFKSNFKGPMGTLTRYYAHIIII